MDDDSDNSVLSEFNKPPSTIHHQTPKNPIDEFHRFQNQKVEDSPNARLAEFFAKKGNEPLSEIELEGVKSLLAKSNSPKQILFKQSQIIDTKEEEEDEANNTNEQILKNSKSESSVKSTPSFKATYNKSISEDNTFDNSINSITSQRKKRIFDFSGFPSPYRTTRFKDTSFLLDDDDNEHQNKKHTLSSESTIEPKNSLNDDSGDKKEKKISNTASALLSFIEGKDDEITKNYEEQQNQPKKDKKIDYSNPYASISSSHKRRTNSSANKPSKFEQEFEKYKESIETKKDKITQPQLKYKPSKSSSLRETISLNDTTDQSIDDIEVETKVETNVETKDDEKIDKETISNDDKSQEKFTKEDSAPKFNSKPLFSFASKPNIPTFGSATSETKPEQSKPFEFKPMTNTTTIDNTIDNTNNTNNTNSITTNTTNSQLTPFSFPGNVITKDSRPPSSEFTFTFPKAEKTGYTINDVDEEYVNIYKPYFTF
ncbi:Muscle M-line assembly protein unc-89 [Wickerhamomyces ciferrii]|uniref:Muscle M-line assembly protein unc-89 n=1 Tax=Wickerhamomyces ciferrii (strain ATCC 14091 / BCRC 22168 / CBS 111 / JCM 3599 / NBRC 0793 / NRRL Y-1031 F-60-10) TaxID=1206466 RepID=K0KHF1_WICCF|nr:Muscle M-line assembly protein unc-89 [Wickerhamomyces ciferrii]CCH42441.1 Muscle M-line assembly protein unc-89 [Wickerhamomyces ciferrii]